VPTPLAPRPLTDEELRRLDELNRRAEGEAKEAAQRELVANNPRAEKPYVAEDPNIGRALLAAQERLTPEEVAAAKVIADTNNH
jgi:hypothetical protein